MAVTLVFFMNGVAFSSWVSRIPQIQRKLGISEGGLGLALLALGIGALLALTVSGWLTTRLGSRPVVTATAILVAVLLPLLALAPSLATLSAALFLFGMVNGALDVSMNAQGVFIQHHFGRPILSSMHAAFSLGGFAGAAVGGLIASAGVAPELHLTGVGLAGGIASVFIVRPLLSGDADPGGGGAGFARPSRGLAALGIVAFCGLLIEGAMADWSAVYLSNVLETGPGISAAGFAAFSLTMAAGRVTGDRLVFLFNPVRIARYGGVLTVFGLVLTLVVSWPLLAIIGFALVGAGLSNLIPIVFGAAGRYPGLAPGPAIAAVASTGYLGFLTGPPIIGLVAELVTLRVALVSLVLLATLATLLAGTIRRNQGGVSAVET